jgi:hypothetical protein
MRPERVYAVLNFIAAALLTVTGAIIGAPPAYADDRPCGTHDEWDQVDVFMSKARVADIIGSTGNFISDSGDVTRRGYNLCWTSDTGVVRYDDQSGLSVHKAVRDLD